MDNFKQLLEEDIRSKLSGRGIALAGYARDLLLRKVGSARASGRLDLRTLVADLQYSLDYFLGHQGQEPSLSSIAAFIKHTLKTEIPQETITSMLPTRANINLNTPHAEDIQENFEWLIDHSGMAQDDLDQVISNINAYMRDPRDEELVVEWVKYLRIKHPDILKLPEMEKLAPLGERIGDENVEKILIAIARNILRNEAEGEDGSEESPLAEPTGEEGDDDDPEDEEKLINPAEREPLPANPTNLRKNRIIEKGQVIAQLQFGGAGGGITAQKIDKWMQDSSTFNGETGSGEVSIEWLSKAFNVEEMSRKSAIIYAFISQFKERSSFDKLLFKGAPFQEFLYRRWPTALAAHEYARSGGNLEELADDIQHYFGTRELSASFFYHLLHLFVRLKGQPPKEDT